MLSDHAIDEKKFIVIMVTKPKAAEVTPAGPADPTVQSSTQPAVSTPAAAVPAAPTPTARDEPPTG